MFGRKGGVGRVSHYRLIRRHLLIFRDQNEHSMLVKNKQANFTFVLCFIHQVRHLSKTLCKLRGSRPFLALYIFIQPKIGVTRSGGWSSSVKVLGEARPAGRGDSIGRGQSWQGVQRRNGPHWVLCVLRAPASHRARGASSACEGARPCSHAVVVTEGTVVLSGP